MGGANAVLEASRACDIIALASGEVKGPTMELEDAIGAGPGRPVRSIAITE
jgi:hypothetical protein